MPVEPTHSHHAQTMATTDDIRRILGDLDETKVLDILRLEPSVIDLEEASVWLSGDKDIFGPGQLLKRVAGDIVAILIADEEEDRTRGP